MRRRDLLVTAAAVAIAGCSSDGTSTDPSSDDEDEDETDNETDSLVDENETTNETDTEGNESDDDQDDTTDEEDAEAQQRERVDEGIETARGHVKSAVKTYRSFSSDGDTIADVVAGDSIDAALVRRDLDDATSALDGVREDAAEDQQETIATIDAVIDYIDLTLAVDERWDTVLEAGTTLRDEILTESGSSIKSQRDSLSETAGTIETRLEKIDADVNSEKVASSDLVLNYEVEEKRAVIDDQLSSVDRLLGLTDAMLAEDALPGWLEGVQEYAVDENYTASWSTFYAVTREYEDIGFPGEPVLFSDEFASLENLATTLTEAAKELELSSDEYRSDEPTSGYYRYERALDILSKGEYSANLPSRQTLEDATPPE